ncbi:MAG: RHS domain-containing protein, partial [Desulfobacterales bacterium]
FASGAVYYYLNNYLGTPLLLTDSQGQVVWDADYRPFGEAQVPAGWQVTNNFRFAGQYYDQETGLHYNYHRYYDPKTGRYLTPDPIGLLGGINLYSYVDNNPINYFDANGLDKSLPPNQRYIPQKPLKQTPDKIRFIQKPAPKITPRGHKPLGINNLPGSEKLPISDRISKGPRIFITLTEGLKQLLKIFGIGIYPLVIIEPNLMISPQERIEASDPWKLYDPIYNPGGYT